MYAGKQAIFLACTAVMLGAGCAASPEIEARRDAIEADIDDILTLTLDEAEFGGPRRCLSEAEFRTFRPLGERHILFYGRRNKLWVNSVHGRCREMRDSRAIVTKTTTGSRLCDKDRFQAADWFEWPWYRGWSSNSAGPECILGEFRPVSQEQVDEIEARLADW